MVAGEPGTQRLADGHLPVFAAFRVADVQHAGVDVDVVDAEQAGLGAAQAAGVDRAEQHRHDQVAQRNLRAVATAVGLREQRRQLPVERARILRLIRIYKLRHDSRRARVLLGDAGVVQRLEVMAGRGLGHRQRDLPAHQAALTGAGGELANDREAHGIRERLEDGQDVHRHQVGRVVVVGGRTNLSQCLTSIKLICTMQLEQ
jgi:hypothetical protein